MYGILREGSLIAKMAAPTSVVSNNPIFEGDSLSLKVHISRSPAQRWEIETRLEPKVDGAGELFALFVEKGFHDPHSVTMPQNVGAVRRRTASGTPTVSGNAGAASVTVTGMTGLLPAGTFVRFASHSKVYMTLNDLTGAGTLRVYPALARAASGNMSYKDDVVARMLLDSSSIRGMAYTDGILMDNGVVKFKEDLRDD